MDYPENPVLNIDADQPPLSENSPQKLNHYPGLLSFLARARWTAHAMAVDVHKVFKLYQDRGPHRNKRTR